LKKTIQTRIFSEMKGFTALQKQELDTALNAQGNFTLK